MLTLYTEQQVNTIVGHYRSTVKNRVRAERNIFDGDRRITFPAMQQVTSIFSVAGHLILLITCKAVGYDLFDSCLADADTTVRRSVEYLQFAAVTD